MLFEMCVGRSDLAVLCLVRLFLRFSDGSAPPFFPLWVLCDAWPLLGFHVSCAKVLAYACEWCKPFGWSHLQFHVFGSAWSLCTNHHKFWLLHGQKKLQLSGWQLTIVLRDCKTNRRLTAVACLQSLLVACLRCLVRKCYTNWFLYTFDVCKVLGAGSWRRMRSRLAILSDIVAFGHLLQWCSKLWIVSFTCAFQENMKSAVACRQAVVWMHVVKVQVVFRTL